MVKARLSVAEKQARARVRKRKGSRQRIQTFFSNSEKTFRLRQKSAVRETHIKQGIFYFRAGSRNLVAKMRQMEDIARENLRVLHQEHAAALKRGDITANTYILGKTRYVFADPKQSVTERVTGVGLDILLDIIYCLKNKSQTKKVLVQRHPGVAKIITFIKRNPGITRENLMAMRTQLRNNLNFVSSHQTNFSYDVNGSNNIRIRNFDSTTGQFRIALIDQIYPGTGNQVAQILAARKRKTKKSS